MTTPMARCLGHKAPRDTPPPDSNSSVRLQSPTVSSFSPGPSSSILKSNSNQAGSSTLSAKKVRFQDTGGEKTVNEKNSEVQPHLVCATVQTCVPKESLQDSSNVGTSSPPTSSATQPLMSPPPPANTLKPNSSRIDSGSKKSLRSRTAHRRKRGRKKRKVDEEVEKGVDEEVEKGVDEEEYEVEAIVDHRKTSAFPDVEYLVKWKGFPHSENSWVRVCNMSCWDLIQDYLPNVFQNNISQEGDCATSPPQSVQLATPNKKKTQLNPQQSSLSVLDKRDDLCGEEVVEVIVIPDENGREERPNQRNCLKQQTTTDRDPTWKSQSTSTTSVRTDLQNEQTQNVTHKEPVSSTARGPLSEHTSRTSTKTGKCDEHTEVSSASDVHTESPPSGCRESQFDYSCESQPDYNAESPPSGCREPPLPLTNHTIDMHSSPVQTSPSTTAAVGHVNATPCQSSAQETTQFTTLGSKTLTPPQQSYKIDVLCREEVVEVVVVPDAKGREERPNQQNRLRQRATTDRDPTCKSQPMTPTSGRNLLKEQAQKVAHKDLVSSTARASPFVRTSRSSTKAGKCDEHTAVSSASNVHTASQPSGRSESPLAHTIHTIDMHSPPVQTSSSTTTAVGHVNTSPCQSSAQETSTQFTTLGSKTLTPPQQSYKIDVLCREEVVAVPDAKGREERPNQQNHLRQRTTTDRDPTCKSQPMTPTSVRYLHTPQKVAHKDPVSSTACASPFVRTTRASTKPGQCDAHTAVSSASNVHTESPPSGWSESQLPHINHTIEMCSPPVQTSTSTTAEVYVNASPCQSAAQERTQFAAAAVGSKPLAQSPQQSSLSVLHKRDILCREEVVAVAVPDAKGKEERPNQRYCLRQRATTDRDPTCKSQPMTPTSVRNLHTPQKVAHKEPVSSTARASPFVRTTRASTKAGKCDAHTEVSSALNAHSESPPSGCRESQPNYLHYQTDVLCREVVAVPDAKGKEERPNLRNRLRQRATTDRDPMCKSQPMTPTSVRNLHTPQKVAHKDPVSSTARASPFVRTTRASTKAGQCDAHTEVSSALNAHSESPPSGCRESQPNYYTVSGCIECSLPHTIHTIDMCSLPVQTSTSTTAVVYINTSPCQSSAQETMQFATAGSASSHLHSPLTQVRSAMKQQTGVSDHHNRSDSSVPQYSPPASPSALLLQSEPSSLESSLASVSPISSFRLHLDSPSSDNGTTSNDTECTSHDTSTANSDSSIANSDSSIANSDSSIDSSIANSDSSIANSDSSIVNSDNEYALTDSEDTLSGFIATGSDTLSDSSLTWSDIIDSPPSSPQASAVVISSTPKRRQLLKHQLRAGNIKVYPSKVPLPSRIKNTHKLSRTAPAVHSSSNEYNPHVSLPLQSDGISYELAAMVLTSHGRSVLLVPRQRLNGIATPSQVSLPQDHHHLSSQSRIEAPLSPQCNRVEGKTIVTPLPPSSHKVEAKTVWPSLPPSTNGIVQKSLPNRITMPSEQHLRNTLDTCEAAAIGSLVSRTSPSTMPETRHFAPSKRSRPEETGSDGDNAIETWSTARLRKRSRSLSPPHLSDSSSPKRRSPRFLSNSTKSVSSTRATHHTPQLNSQPLPYSLPPSRPPPRSQPHPNPTPRSQSHPHPLCDSQRNPRPPPPSQPHPHTPPPSQPHPHTPPPSQPHPHTPPHSQPHPHTPPPSQPHPHTPPHSQPHPHTPPHSQPHPHTPPHSQPSQFQPPTPPATVSTPISSPRILATNNSWYQEHLQSSPTPPVTRSSPRIFAMNNACYQDQLLEWQYELNRQRQGTGELIYVENCVDQAPAPRDFTYIASSIYGEGVPDPDNPANTEHLCGCTCYLLGKKCNSKAEHCCPHMAGERFPYTIAGKVKIPPGSPIYECNSKCSCPYDCANRVVQRGRTIPLCIFRTHNGRGWGVKTVVPIKANTFVTEYVGEVITSEEAERRGKQYDKKGATYLFDLDFVEENAVFTIDAAKFGNLSHFFNHSCNPNLVVYSVWIETVDARLPRIAFFTTRVISAGEELTFDYQMSTSQSDTENGCIPCLCGADNCIGFLN